MGEATAAAGMVIVGGGECGARTAFKLRELGWTGSVTVFGRERLHAYERPPLSKTTLTGDDPSPVHPYTKHRFDEASITVRTATQVRRIDTDQHEVSLADGNAIPYHKVLLAVGAQPRRLPFAADADLLYLRTHDDALRLKGALQPGQRIGILGAGFIGLELAASARSRGCDVTVVEVAERTLGRAVPAPIASEIAALHERRGVKFHFRTGVERLTRDVDSLRAHTSSGEVLCFDTVVVGIGAAPDVSLAEASGLTIDNGIAVDDRLRASAIDVFAAGDCASFPHPLFGGQRLRLEAWRNAHDQADTAAANMLGADQPHISVPWFWSDHYDHSLQVAGLTAMSTSTVVRERDDGVRLHFGLDEQQRLVCASGFGPGGAVARDIRLAEMLLARRTSPATDLLVDPSVPLKRLLTDSRERRVNAS